MKRSIIILVIMALMLSAFASAQSGISRSQAYKGSVVTYGSYEQDNNYYNGSESIQWVVIRVAGDKVLLVSLYGLDSKPYNNTYTNVTWASCSLRSWLNDTFYNTAFSSSEKAGIAYVRLTNDNNPTYHTAGGVNTSDHVFILSYSETLKYLPKEYRAATATAYAARNTSSKAWTSSRWWMRTPAKYHDDALYVNNSGIIYDAEGQRVDGGNQFFTVRPAMWVHIV